MTVQIEIPDSINMTDRQIRMILAAKFYEMGLMSLGRAAEMVGYSKSTFMELLGDYDVSLFQMTAEDLKSDFENAKRYHQRQQLSNPAS